MHRRAPVRAATALVALVLAVGVAGCSASQPANDTLPGTTTAATTTADALPPLGPPDFPVPDAARQQTPEGAAAFTEYYIGLISFTTTTLDATAIRQLSRDCEVCDQIANGYDKDRKAGYRYEGGELAITSAGAPNFMGDTSRVAFLLKQTALRVLDSAGNVANDREYPEFGLNGGVSLLWDDGLTTWVATSLTAERD